MIREILYDEIHDAQRHFRTLLDTMSRPGRISRFHHVALTPPPGLYLGSTYVALALLNADATFHGWDLGADVATYLKANTQSRAVAVAEADYLFASGNGDNTVVPQLKLGQLTYPETGASLVLQVGHLGKSSATGGIQLTLTGPGVEVREIAFVTGLKVEWLVALRERNAEFPLGLDTYLVSEDENVLCLPRTTRVEWEIL